MDSTDAPQSGEVLQPFSKSPFDQALRQRQDLNPWSSKTPEKPIDRPRRSLDRGAVLSELPEKYEILDEFFRSLNSSIRLLRMKGSITTFTNISTKIKCLTDRRFTHGHLAQLKFILPEAIKIRKILVHDERTSWMKPDLHIELDVKAVVDRNNVPLEGGDLQLRKIFRSCLVDYVKAHPQGDEIPEEVLPELNYSKRTSEVNPTTTLGSLMVTEIPQRASSEATQSPVLSPSFPQLKPQNNCPLPEPASLEKVSSEATRDVDCSCHEVSSACLPVSPTLATPEKHATSDTKANSSAATPVQCVSTPAKLMSSTPMLLAPKRCYMTPDDQLTGSPNKLVRRPSRNRSLKFDTPDKNAKAEDDAEVQGCSSVADDILDILPEDLLKSIREKEEKAILEQNPAISQAKWRKQMIAGLPKLFNMVHFLFQSIRRSVLTKEELIHRLLSSHLDIVDRREIEEQLELLLELAPEWIYEKLASSGDYLCGVKKIPSPELIRSKLAEAK